MSKALQKKKDWKPQPRKLKKTALAVDDGEVKLLVLEHGIPITAKSGKEESQKLRAALTQIFDKAKPGDSTVIAAKSTSTAIRHLRERFPEYSFRVSFTDKTKRFSRIWRTK